MDPPKDSATDLLDGDPRLQTIFERLSEKLMAPSREAPGEGGKELAEAKSAQRWAPACHCHMCSVRSEHELCWQHALVLHQVVDEAHGPCAAHAQANLEVFKSLEDYSLLAAIFDRSCLYARDDRLQAPAEQLKGRINALEEENRQLASCISQIRSSQRSILEGAATSLSANSVAGDSSLRGSDEKRSFLSAQERSEAASSNEVIVPAAPAAPPSVPAQLPRQVVIETPRVAMRESGPSGCVPTPGPKSSSPTQAPVPDASSLNASTVSCEATLVSDQAASTIQASPALSHAAAQAEAKASFLEAASKRGSGFAEVYNELLSCALQVFEARATAASMEKERNQASSEARELRACNARLEEAVSTLQDRNKELWQKEFQRWRSKPAFRHHQPERGNDGCIGPGRHTVWAAPLSPSPRPRSLQCPVTATSGVVPRMCPLPARSSSGLAANLPLAASHAVSHAPSVPPLTPLQSPRRAWPSAGHVTTSAVAASPMQQRLDLAARLPPKEQQTPAFQHGWRFFHQLSKDVKDTQVSSLDGSARQRASALMLQTNKGMPTEFRKNPAVCAVWREALLAGANSELMSSQSFSSSDSIES
ncbi:NEK1 [Symbiodinium natans]|uniref:NEK1 protein n=1 Tax=Symbiodinium natans TaxID=878477 RepID=A0A812T3J8_9DINO|nr:NEK1 [Symbiodinium natans]